MKGKFITFEGSEGCGKSTQSMMLCQYLRAKGLKIVYLREPGGTKISEKIRRILLDHRNNSMSSVCEMLLYMSARAQIVEQVIKPALKQGKIVICDRFLDSTIAYQGYGLGMDIKTIRYVGDLVTSGIRPDLTVFLDLPVKKGLNVRSRVKDRIERRTLNYHFRVRQGYLKLAAQEPNRIKIVKVALEKSETQSNIRGLIDKYVF
ncbi:MAG: dTMP kinase [Candidatus Omnitrophota bacterium]|nr:dTMP kinase [Candidatus Omnitrophota bacterium]MBU1928598.1 dTMP kinase [Candidatus Omnitrophota bacterium]MBU2034611.1 dTMP kinase [Candidatus Omnitrophota bacterium]MBU2221136.1 dTMP kinase [Candidatus Omnitrophota bacterium]MBU2258427.1 dTMP kinase [Candidatus Omnitrophota bacterium]